MTLSKSDVLKAFLDIQQDFPFNGYLNGRLKKYNSIVSVISARLTDGSNVLSLGSGPCDLEAILAKLGFNVVAIDDLSEHWHLIGNNRQRIIEFAKRSKVDLRIQSVCPLVAEQNYFDAVLLIDLIEHLDNSPRELLNNAIACLKPNGILLILTPNAVSLIKRLKAIFGKSSQTNIDLLYWNIGQYRFHTREFTCAELKKVAAYHNLISIRYEMKNILVNTIEHKSCYMHIAALFYNNISGMYPNFRDTILFSGIKPSNWMPTPYSIHEFKKTYPILDKYSLDDQTDSILANEVKGENPLNNIDPYLIKKLLADS